jgi:hypothetical protein
MSSQLVIFFDQEIGAEAPKVQASQVLEGIEMKSNRERWRRQG